jgi:putative oxidoreductase
MKHYRNLPRLEDFRTYSPSAAELSRARSRTYEPVERLTRGQLKLSWISRSIAAAIMIETLFFKFTGAEESVYIFSKMGMESWWRYGQGIWELIASILLLTPRLGWAGGILTLGALGGAIVSHLTILGIEVQGDHGLLFSMAVVTFVCGFIVTFLHRREIPSYAPMTPY